MSVTPLLEIKNLHVSVEDKKVLKDLSICILPGEVHAIMGANGSGKSTLSATIMGHPHYKVTKGSIYFKGKDIASLSTEERAKLRIFLAFQNPITVSGLTVGRFLRSSMLSVRKGELSLKEVRSHIRKEASNLGIGEEFLRRSLNDGFSGGEKKRMETLQLRLLEPELAVLDETDSGLDIDSLSSVASSILSWHNNKRSMLLITHYQRILSYIKPDHVHVLLDGSIVKSGCAQLAEELEDRGYQWLQKKQS